MRNIVNILNLDIKFLGSFEIFRYMLVKDDDWNIDRASTVRRVEYYLRQAGLDITKPIHLGIPVNYDGYFLSQDFPIRLTPCPWCMNLREIVQTITRGECI